MRQSLLLCLFAFGLVGTAMADEPSPQADVRGLWSIETCFDGADCTFQDVLLNQIGPIVIADPGYGFSLGSFVALLFVRNDCRPLYVGSVVSSLMLEGSVECTDGSGDSGVWQARFIAAP